MCKVLKISRNLYYTYKDNKKKKDPITDKVIEIFIKNQSVYGTRKIKIELKKLGITASRRKIGRIMSENGLVSAYTVKQYKAHKDNTNQSQNPNLVDREFNNRKNYEVIVSDLTYVRVKNKWNYICILLDLYNREIIGYSAGEHKNAMLVYKAISTVKANLNNFQIFHTDRGSEFNNYLLDDMLKVFNIKRSLSAKGCPYDNAVAEAQFKIIKTEFVKSRWFISLEHLQNELADYVYWFNNKRIHSSLDYKSPAEFKQALL